MTRESQSPLQKLQNRYLWNGSVLAGLAALVLTRFAWVRLLVRNDHSSLTCGE